MISSAIALGFVVANGGCGSKSGGSTGSGGNPGSNGSGGSTPGVSGGASGTPTGSGGSGTGGAPTTGSGGAAAGGSSSGGAPAGSTGGNASGTGGGPVDAGAPDGSPVTDASTPAPPFSASFHIGADITWVQHDEFYGATYLDTDGTPKDILALLKNHGFNSIRLRTFVDPKATDGYDLVDGFGDQAHTITMAQRIRAAGMGFYLAIHYSDNWADPGKQCVPIAWQGATTIAALAAFVHDYTFNLITALKNAGAAPQLVQVGNEITSGMLIHRCGAGGLPAGTNPVGGAIANWTNLGTLLKAGVAGVKEVDPTIKTVLHLDRAASLAASASFITNARTQQVPFDVFGDSMYVYWHGQPSGWQTTYNGLVTMFPTLSFVIPEYGNETATSPALTSTMRFVNDLVFNMSTNRGLGTWFYEPEHPFQAGPMPGLSLGIGLFDTAKSEAGVPAMDSWPVFPALGSAMSIYDTMKTAYAARL